MKTYLLCLALVSWSALASEALTSASMDEVIAKVEEKAAQYGRNNVLVVFDIDNTLLTMTNDLGSDQWYSWQEKIVKPGCSNECVSQDIAGLLTIQNKLFAVGTMKLTETSLDKKIKELQAKGQKVIALTSRSHELRNLTEGALNANGINLASSSVGPEVVAQYIPYDLKNLTRSGLTEADVQTAGLKEARPVSFQNGVYMTAGQNKGVMLKVLLNRYRKSYKAIVFADDHQRHVDRMQAIMGNLSDVTTYRYSQIDPQVNAFNASDKSVVVEKWKKLESTLKEVGF